MRPRRRINHRSATAIISSESDTSTVTNTAVNSRLAEKKSADSEIAANQSSTSKSNHKVKMRFAVLVPNRGQSDSNGFPKLSTPLKTWVGKLDCLPVSVLNMH